MEFTDASVRLDEVDLDILVPTLNRPKATEFNQRWICQILKNLNPDFTIRITISENASQQDLRMDHDSLLQSENIETVLIRRAERLPLGEHMEWLSNLSNAKYHLWCGDDDLMHPDFIRWIIGEWENIIERDYQAIMSNNTRCNQSEFFQASAEFTDNALNATLHKSLANDAYRVIARGNQLSGILVKKTVEDNIWREEKLPAENLYPWMAFIANILSKKKFVVELEDCPVLITSDTQKHFTYRQDGLFCEISEAVRLGLKRNKVSKYMITAFVMGRVGCWRIFQTNPNKIVCMINYFKLIVDSRVNFIVWILALPFVVKRFFMKLLKPNV